MVVMLLRHEWDPASTRADLFGGHLNAQPPSDRPPMPYRARFALTTRPWWVAERSRHPRFNYCWYVWDWAHEGPATTHLLAKVT